MKYRGDNAQRDANEVESVFVSAYARWWALKYRGHNAQRDANEVEIVDTLRRTGASVFRLDQPVDLLVGFRGRTYLLEVKRPRGPRGGTGGSELTPDQRKFCETWRGVVHVVRTPHDALAAIGTRPPATG